MAFKYRHGPTVMVDHVAGSAITAGQCVTLGKWFGIAHSDHESGDLAALSVPVSGAVYECDKDAAADVFAVGDIVEVDISAAKITPAADANGNGACGRVVKASANGDTTVWVSMCIGNTDHTL